MRSIVIVRTWKWQIAISNIIITKINTIIICINNRCRINIIICNKELCNKQMLFINNKCFNNNNNNCHLIKDSNNKINKILTDPCKEVEISGKISEKKKENNFFRKNQFFINFYLI